MYNKLIETYVNKLTKEQISNFARKKNIILDDYELNIIYTYIKKYWKVFYKDDPKNLFVELQTKLKEETYLSLISLYKEYKSKL